MSYAKVISQFEVMPAGSAGRRRYWSDADKVRIVEESLRGHRQGSAIARRYDISRSLLTRWRRAYRGGFLDGNPGPSFAPVHVVPEGSADFPSGPASVAGAPAVAPGGSPPERVGITLTNGRRLDIALSVDDIALVRLVQILERT